MTFHRHCYILLFYPNVSKIIAFRNKNINFSNFGIFLYFEIKCGVIFGCTMTVACARTMKYTLYMFLYMFMLIYVHVIYSVRVQLIAQC